MTRTRALEAYWSGFVGWLFAALDRRWFGSVTRSRLRAAALDVGEGLIVARTGSEVPAVAALERFAWLVGIAAAVRELDRDEAARARNACAVVSKMLARAPAEAPPPSPAPTVPRSPGRSPVRIRAASSSPTPAHRTLVPATPTAG